MSEKVAEFGIITPHYESDIETEKHTINQMK